LVMHLKLPHSGYLNVINIDPSDQAFIVYPADKTSNNFVKSGSLTLPTPEMGYALQLTEPRGANLFLAVLSKQAINIYQGSDNAGVFDGDKLKRFEQVLKAKRTSQYWAGKLVIDVK